MFNDAEGEIYRLQDEKEWLKAEIKRLREALASAVGVLRAVYNDEPYAINEEDLDEWAEHRT